MKYRNVIVENRMHCFNIALDTMSDFNFNCQGVKKYPEYCAAMLNKRNKICSIKINQKLCQEIKETNSRIFAITSLESIIPASPLPANLLLKKAAIFSPVLIKFCENLAICLLICSGIYYVNNNFHENLIT